jgi:hypothetical protein
MLRGDDRFSGNSLSFSQPSKLIYCSTTTKYLSRLGCTADSFFDKNSTSGYGGGAVFLTGHKIRSVNLSISVRM